MVPSTVRPEVNRLTASAAHLVHHLSACDICHEAGTRYCTELDDLLVVFNDDRRKAERAAG